MKIAADSPPTLSALDRPNSYIGRSVPRPNLARLTQGRGQFVSDMTLPRMAHVAFVRSPHAQARIATIATTAAKKAPGVIAVVTGAELAGTITPWVGVLTHLKGLKSAPQHAIAVERACWQGEAVCAVVARTRAEAEDACELVEVEYEQLPPLFSYAEAMAPDAPLVHEYMGSNVAVTDSFEWGDVEAGLAEADHVFEDVFTSPAVQHVPLETHACIAQVSNGQITVWAGAQIPFVIRSQLAEIFRVPASRVRTVSMGKEQPFCSEDNESCWQQNRRGHFLITAK